MVLLSIGYTLGKCDICGKLSELSTYFKEKNINIGLVESDSQDMHFIKCVIRDEEDRNYNMQELKENFNIYAANILYQVIVDNFEIDTINKIIKENYQYFKADEVEGIIKKCIDILKGTAITSSEDYMLHINRKNAVVNKILDCVNEYNDLILEGFLTFRLRELNNELESIVDKVVEEYLIEREYNEFIKLLRYFVEIQESRIDVVNIVANTGGNYDMYDNNCNEITKELLKELMGDNIDCEKNFDDLLVSSLISIAPRYIVIHNASNITNKEVIDTIKNVFFDRVKICSGCDLCIKISPFHKV